ncbi:zinc ribbon domain-containing protein [Boudabousia marimammalium]|uniref:CT398-like coiled coil hairpin domain-containing protein n=1 Tax=Boudabousia marimammalium TaxID=156892 RepID=A0A1Q5PP52_9ACTO|nr:hypothetical protein [Boudabousia marimammalium]OKL49205.1 hypothetical protein BM477_04215 [Boudabousia marimammalium]
MKASPRQQLELLVMQECDTKLARLTYDAQNLPEHKKLAEITGRRDDMTRFVATAQSELGDQRREAQKITADVERLKSRQALTQERLDKGLGDMKELQRMQDELDTIAKRLEKVEYQQMESDETIAELETRLENGKKELVALNEDVAATMKHRDELLADLKSQAQPLIDKRRAAMEIVGPELTAEYDAIRKSTGGLGAVALRGRVVESMSIQFTATEWERIRSAAPDEVITSEDMEWILVRVED